MNITHTLAASTLTVALDGRLDTASVPAVEQQIEQLLLQTPQVESIVIDAQKLEYISSSGLRIMLKYKKRYDNFSIINASLEVYNVFEMSGFSRIMNISKALRKIDLSNMKVLASGGMGAVYKISEEEIIKVNHIAGSDEELADEMRRAKAAFVAGVPTAISYDVVDCGDGRKGVIYEALNSETLSDRIDQHPEDIDWCIDQYIYLLKTLHSTTPEPGTFDKMKDIFAKRYEQTAQYLTTQEIDKVFSMLDAIPEAGTLIHGDAHPKNILLNGPVGAKEPMFIDMADMGTGHPIFELSGIALATLRHRMMPDDPNFKFTIGLSMQQARSFVSKAISKLYHISGEKEIYEMEDRIYRLGFLKRVSIISWQSPGINKVRSLLIDNLRTEFFPNIEQHIDDVKYFAELVKSSQV